MLFHNIARSLALSSGLVSLLVACDMSAGPSNDLSTRGQGGADDVEPPRSPAAEVGGPCAATSDCRGGDAPVCIQPDLDWRNGYCTSGCDAHEECGDNGGCVAYADGTTACLALCSFDSDCRDGYSCLYLDGPGFCYPRRLADAARCDELGFWGECTNGTVYWCQNGRIEAVSCSNGCYEDDEYGWVCR